MEMVKGRDSELEDESVEMIHCEEERLRKFGRK